MISLTETNSHYGPIRRIEQSLDYSKFSDEIERAIIASTSLSFSTEALCRHGIYSTISLAYLITQLSALILLIFLHAIVALDQTQMHVILLLFQPTNQVLVVLVLL